MRSIGGPEILVILLVFLLLFGGRKLPDLARGLGEGIKNFKKSVKSDDDVPAEEKKSTGPRV